MLNLQSNFKFIRYILVHLIIIFSISITGCIGIRHVAIEDTPLLSSFGPFNSTTMLKPFLRQGKYHRFHPRLEFWRYHYADIKDNKLFTDHTDNRYNMYARYKDRWQHLCHFMPSALVPLLDTNDAEKYFIEIKGGMYANAILEYQLADKEGKKYKPERFAGHILMKFCTNYLNGYKPRLIYHMMFHDRQASYSLKRSTSLEQSENDINWRKQVGVTKKNNEPVAKLAVRYDNEKTPTPPLSISYSEALQRSGGLDADKPANKINRDNGWQSRVQIYLSKKINKYKDKDNQVIPRICTYFSKRLNHYVVRYTCKPETEPDTETKSESALGSGCTSHPYKWANLYICPKE